MKPTTKIGLWGGFLGGSLGLWALYPSLSAESIRDYGEFYKREALSIGNTKGTLGAGSLAGSQAALASFSSKDREAGSSYEGLDTFDMLQVLKGRVRTWSARSPLCSGHPSKGQCDDGDSVLFNGLLCNSGLEMGCETVKKSLNPRTGEWVRSPRRVDYSPLADQDAKSFSRDHMLGILLYTAKTGDFAAYDSWKTWMRESPKCLLHLAGRCWFETQVTHLCRTFDFGCLYLPGVNRLSDTVLGLAGARHKQWRIAEGGNLSTELILRLELKTTSPGYPLHLKAVSLLLLGSLGYDQEFVSDLSLELVKRDPRNLFFQYLYDDSRAGTLRQSQALLDQCQVSFYNLDKKDGTHNQWSFERDTGEKAWRNSMGWDCVFLGRMLTERLSDKVTQTEVSDLGTMEAGVSDLENPVEVPLVNPEDSLEKSFSH